MSSDDYKYWRDALVGEAPARNPSEFETGACGRWKMKRRHDGDWDRLAIWKDVNTLKYYYRFNDEQTHGGTDTPPEIRGFAYALPVSANDYTRHANEGVWPGEVPHLIRNSDNVSEYDTLRDNVDATAQRALAWLESTGTITTQELCDIAANYRQSLMNMSARAGELKAEELKPLKKHVDDCNKKWSEVITNADNSARKMRDASAVFLLDLDKKAREAAAEAQAVLDEEYENLKEIDLPLAMTAKVIDIAPKKVSAGGQAGRKMGVQSRYVAEIVDFQKALIHFASNPKVVDLIASLANAAARSKEKPDIPGVVYKEKRSVI